jgi:N-acetylmuramoyl-L-alanine amidase
MFNVALNAGHYLGTPGKCCPKSLDPKMTKEWVLNNRIVTKMQSILSVYEEINVLRVDDPMGLESQSFSHKRTKVNEFNADFFLGVHHNAAGKEFDGGGIVAFCTVNPSEESISWRDELYKESVTATGLKGNRATPLVERDLKELQGLNCPAVLMECGFMDSRVDCLIILTEEFADKMAKALVAVILRKAGIKEIIIEEPKEEPTKKKIFVTIQLPVLTLGCKGENVKVLQVLLNANGAKLDLDKSFGPATEKALKEFQTTRKLSADGSCGPATWTALLHGEKA